MPRPLSHSMVVDDMRTLDLHGDLEGTYVVEETRPDGALVIRRDFSLAESLKRDGLRQLTGDEIPAVLRDLPTDDEG